MRIGIIPEYMQLLTVKKGGFEEIEEFAGQTLAHWKTLKNKPTAVIAMSDNSALSFIRKAHKLEIRMP